MSTTGKTSSRKKAAAENKAVVVSPVASALIIGAGFGGLGAAIRLQQQGINDVVILERAADVGGTWRDNSYPGAACDIPSNLYSYSFAQNPEWTRAYSGSREILSYVHHLVEKFSLRPLIRFGCNVTGLVFREEAGVWDVTIASGEILRARSVISASGGLSNASLPKITGIETFEGHKVHSARWDHDYGFKSKRVAVIGTGASGVQIIPELVKVAASVKVFQRTPGWVLPRGAQAYKSMSVSGYPNLFFILGPNSGPGHNSALVYMESQIGYAVQGISMLLNKNLKALDVKPDVQKQHNIDMQKRLSKTNWNSGCKSWYLTEDGYNATMYPGFATQYAKQMQHFDPKDYRVVEA